MFRYCIDEVVRLAGSVVAHRFRNDDQWDWSVPLKATTAADAGESGGLEIDDSGGQDAQGAPAGTAGHF